ncbi:TonB-dependent receptor [Phaeodactylibacter luteus]|uniref:TonB-dependent receptor n=1 Tax=Phaeodactylibacter luteus TaxID=1564516 RepID=A0A5C6RLQ6_9BACT|nr:TonB-dependent receptor [Phaeodactylibacter luteus]TXB62560.1 TonB-dependent receptor [Phaeodactylibacter luteus]
MRLFLLAVLALFCTTVFAQTGTIRGTVIEDESGFTVIGANILIKDTSKGTVTDLDGAFSLEVAPGTYTLNISYIGFQDMAIEEVVVTAGEVTLLNELRLVEAGLELEQVVVTAKAIRTTEAALMTIKKKAPAMLDGISSARMQLTGDATAVEAAKRVTGVSIEGGKYIYVRGLGDRYSKTTLNNVDIPGLDPDRNTLQMDIFPTNLIDNIVVSKNFTADMPADFTGGLLNVETKAFPDEKIFNLSVSTSFNPDMHFNDDYLGYEGGNTDFLGYDDGTRALPQGARAENIPTPISGASQQEVTDFIQEFNPTLGAQRQSSLLDFSAGLSLGNQVSVGQSDNKLGYIFSLSYKTDYKYYDEVTYGEFQRFSDPDRTDLRYATIQEGQMGERNFLVGALGGLAYKTQYSKFRLTAMRLQNGESRAAQFRIDNDGEAVGQSGYIAESDNLEYNERSLTNFLLNGTHVLGASGWEIDWRLSPTFSTSDDPDIRKTAFTQTAVDTSFIAGAGGNPSRIWRSLSEVNAVAKFDITKKYKFKGEDAKLKFGASHTYKQRDYEILFFDIQFFGGQDWPNPTPSEVLTEGNIFPNGNRIYYQSGNNTPNPNAYESNVNNTAVYVSNEFDPLPNLKAIIGVRAENYVQRHTGRDQRFASGDILEGNNLDNEKVLDALDFFPSANFIYSLSEQQNLRAAYSRTIARPSFKELSFAQIIDPITNRIFNGSLFEYAGSWDGNLSETRINNLDLRWELFMEGGQLFSVSAFYKQFDNPIELVRIPEQQTSTEFQPRNVGDGQLYGVELEFRKSMNFVSEALSDFGLSGNVTFVESRIDMTATEFNARKNFERTGETVENTRQMAGQAPYVVNAGLTYTNRDKGWDAGLFYNVKGETLQIVGVGLYSDIYYEPFHALNFSLNKKIGKNQNTSIDFKVSNILNDRVESFYQSFEATPEIFNSINPGRSFGLGLSHRF